MRKSHEALSWLATTPWMLAEVTDSWSVANKLSVVPTMVPLAPKPRGSQSGAAQPAYTGWETHASRTKIFWPGGKPTWSLPWRKYCLYLKAANKPAGDTSLSSKPVHCRNILEKSSPEQKTASASALKTYRAQSPRKRLPPRGTPCHKGSRIRPPKPSSRPSELSI